MTDKTAYELKPCPFCGGKGVLGFSGCKSGLSPGKSFVKCEDCGAIGEKFEVSSDYASKEKAVEAWNRRFN